MKLTGIISAVLLFMYGVSTFVGTGVYHCACTHSQRLVIMSVHLSCQCSSSPETCCPHNDQHHHGEDEDDCGNDCCSLEYQNVDVDQLIGKHFYNHLTKVLSLLFYPFLPVNGLNGNVKEYTFAVNNHSPPPDLLKVPLIYMHRQLRL